MRGILAEIELPVFTVVEFDSKAIRIGRLAVPNVSPIDIARPRIFGSLAILPSSPELEIWGNHLLKSQHLDST